MYKIELWQSLLIALWVWLVMSRSLFGQATQYLRNSGLMTGLVCGLILGDVVAGVASAAAIQLVYMGVIGPGGTQPSEPAVATAVAVPTALLGGLSPEASISIAIPVGILGTYLYQGRFFINSFVMRLTDRYAVETNDRGLDFSIIILPMIVSFVIFVPVVFLAVQYGAPFIAEWLSTAASESLMHILDVIGGGLAAVGIAAAAYIIGRNEYMTFFIIFYFGSVVASGVNTLIWAIIAAAVAYIYVTLRNETKDLINS
jgi:PTS system mannose-specific IIC component